MHCGALSQSRPKKKTNDRQFVVVVVVVVCGGVEEWGRALR